MDAPFKESGGTALERFMLCAGDNFVLEVFSEIAEVIAVAGDANDEIPMIVRICLRPAKGIGIDYVELDMMPSQVEVCPNKPQHPLDPRIVGEERRRELLIEKGASGPDMVHF